MILFFLFLNIFSFTFSQIPPELKAKKVPLFIRKNVKKLSKFLTKDELTDSAKVRQISLWVVNVIKYDVKNYVRYSEKMYSPKRILKRRKAVSSGYCDLFTALCRESGLTAMTVTGYSKSGGYDFGDVFFNTNHCWNMVKVNGEWKQMDLTWAAGSIIRKRSVKMKARKFLKKPNIKDKLVFKRDVSDFWLTRNAKQFFFKHCPGDPVYLLLNKQNCMDVFENLNTRPDNTSPLSHDSVLKAYKQNFETAAYATEPDPRSIMDRVTR
ncbi:MAG: hypothetical protein IAF38_21670, partial [Bacteroidia bacterium]|nr:hypothetical protein [Bacteroidia bacterium]